MGSYWLVMFGLVMAPTLRTALCMIVEYNSVEPRPTLTEVSFSVVSGRNASGHWNSKLHFSHTDNKGVLEEGNETNAWKMDFDQKIETGLEGQKIHLYATVTIPPAGSEVPTGGDRVATAFAEPVEEEELLAKGYQRVAGLGYYKFHTEPRTWFTALKTCYQESTQLAVVSSDDEASTLRRLFQEHPTIPGANYNDAAFVGANDIENEGVYVTIDDVPLQDVGYLHWQDGQPNNYIHGQSPGQDCIAMSRQAEYLDVECYFKLPFICKKSLGH